MFVNCDIEFCFLDSAIRRNSSALAVSKSILLSIFLSMRFSVVEYNVLIILVCLMGGGPSCIIVWNFDDT